MTPPPLPDGCTGYPVDPHIHTAADDQDDRDGWTDVTPSFDEHVDRVLTIIRAEATT